MNRTGEPIEQVEVLIFPDASSNYLPMPSGIFKILLLSGGLIKIQISIYDR